MRSLVQFIQIHHCISCFSYCRQTRRKYTCDVKDDDDCRCDKVDRPRECCDASRNCRRNCCERCSGGSERKSRSCNLCDDREKKCMRLEDDDDDDDDEDQACEDGDRDCVCVEYENDDGDDEEYCCLVSRELKDT